MGYFRIPRGVFSRSLKNWWGSCLTCLAGSVGPTHFHMFLYVVTHCAKFYICNMFWFFKSLVWIKVYLCQMQMNMICAFFVISGMNSNIFRHSFTYFCKTDDCLWICLDRALGTGVGGRCREVTAILMPQIHQSGALTKRPTW